MTHLKVALGKVTCASDFRKCHIAHLKVET